MTQQVRVIHLIGLIKNKSCDSSIDKVAGYELDVLGGHRDSSGPHVGGGGGVRFSTLRMEVRRVIITGLLKDNHVAFSYSYALNLLA